MGLSAKVGSFNLDSAKSVGQTIAVSDIGFQPVIVFFFWGGSTGTVDTVSGGTITPGFGAAISSSSRCCVIGTSVDGSATTNSNRYQSLNECIRIYVNNSTLDGLMDCQSLDSGGFTLIVDDQFTSNYRISYLALGGTDITNYKIGSFLTQTGTGNYSVSTVGFQPDALLFMSIFSAAESGSGNSLGFSYGMATGSSNQGTVSGLSVHNVADSDTASYGYNGECLSRLNSTTATNCRNSFVSMDINGFTLNSLEGGAANYYAYYIALKGGQYSVGDITSRTDGNDIAETIGFQPGALLFMSANKALSTQDTPTAHYRMSFGAATSASERACAAVSDEDNLADTETAYTNQDDAIYATVIDDAIDGLMDIKSIDSSGFTAVMDDTDTTASWVMYMAFASAAGGGTTLNVDMSPGNIYTTGVKIYTP